jgi:site-specific DNA recombinase
VAANERKIFRCAIYTRKSSEHGLEQNFNSLDAQREAAEAYIKSQVHEGWRQVKAHYDDGGLSGGTLERPALQALLADIRSRKIDVVVVYKVDRLTRSLADFAKLVELFEAHGVSFVAATQQFNTTTSMGSCFRLPSSSGRWQASGSATSSRRPAARACGWAAPSHSAMK